MATMSQRVTDLAIEVATEIKKVRTLLNGNQADLSALTTADKASLVAAVNSVQARVDALASAASINDSVDASTTATYSISKIRQLVNDAMAALVASAPTALNTLDELAAAIGDDANFAASVTAALSNRVRFDTNTQGLTAAQKQNVRTNIDAFGSQEIGNPDTDFVAAFRSAIG